MRRRLPSGTVTFLFTDVEGSTRLLHGLGAETFADALAQHRRLLRAAFARHDGVEVDTQGDAIFCAFPTAPAAIQAAREGQQALASSPIRVRMGVHTGTPHLGAEGYVGPDVHKGARIAAAGHGGQVLLSKEARELADIAEVTDLGEHRLKDFDEPVWIFQLGSERFPPLKTISNTNLPRPASSFVGRGREVAEIVALLRDHARFLTLTGPGGSGKTRLAIEAAAELVPRHRNGVFWVGLAPLRDPALVVETISRTLGAKDSLADYIGERELLLVLDNLEQVVEVGPELAALVESCPYLKVMVTSRERLRVRGEVEYPVSPLAAPEAVNLFCDRAGVEPDETIKEVCRRLDNLPLALELAAARTRVLSAAQILERLSERLDMLKGARDADPRQQTLRATIEWSYELLSREERLIFARLAVFAGGCTLEAAEEETEAAIDTLQSLVDKSLLRHNVERFWMLETIHDFAAERLEDSGEAAELRRRHAVHFLALAEEAEPHLRRHSREWRDRLEHEHDNLRTALRSFLDEGDAHNSHRLASALGEFWRTTGRHNEGRGWLREALALRSGDPRAWAASLTAAGYLALDQGDYNEGIRQNEEAASLQRTLNDDAGLARSLGLLCWAAAAVQGDAARAERHAAEANEAAIRSGDPLLLADSWNNFALAASCAGRPDRSREFGERFVAAARPLHDEVRLTVALNNLAFHALTQDEFAAAQRYLDQVLPISRRAGSPSEIASTLTLSGYAALGTGRIDRASQMFTEAVLILRETGERRWIAECLNGLAGCLADSGDVTWAARLWGAADAQLDSLGLPLVAPEVAVRARYETAVRDLLGDTFDDEKAAGEATPLDEIVDSLPSGGLAAASGG